MTIQCMNKLRKLYLHNDHRTHDIWTIIWWMQWIMVGGNTLPVHSHKSQELASCVQLPTLFLSRESATLEHRSFSELQFPRTILTLKRNAHGLCSARLEVTHHIFHQGSNHQLPTPSYQHRVEVTLLFTLRHMRTIANSVLKEKHWHIASSCTHYWREWLLNEIIV